MQNSTTERNIHQPCPGVDPRTTITQSTLHFSQKQSRLSPSPSSKAPSSPFYAVLSIRRTLLLMAIWGRGSRRHFQGCLSALLSQQQALRQTYYRLYLVPLTQQWSSWNLCHVSPCAFSTIKCQPQVHDHRYSSTENTSCISCRL